MAVVHLVPEVAGVVPTLFILSRHEPAHREVAGGQRLATQLDDAHTTGRQDRAVLTHNANLQVLEQRSQRRQPTRVASGGGNRAAQRGQQVRIDLVDHQARIAFGEGDGQRGLGHPVGRQDCLGPQPERLAGVQQVLDVGGFDGLGAR